MNKTLVKVRVMEREEELTIICIKVMVQEKVGDERTEKSRVEVDRNRFFQFRPKPKMYRRHGAETETETETEHTYSAETETRTEHFYFVINVHP